MNLIRRKLLLGLLLAGAALALAGCDVPPQLALSVTTTIDGTDAEPGDGTCEVTSGGGDCSLRAAIQEANAFTAAVGGHTTITLATASHTLSLVGSDEDAAGTGDLDIIGNVTIVGNAATVDADGLDRVLDVHAGATLALRDMTVTGGTATHGGGVRNNLGATTRIDRTTIAANEVNGYTTCYLSPTGSSCDQAPGGGGGVWNRGSLTLLDSTLEGNTATGRGECTYGGSWAECYFHGGGGLMNSGVAVVLTTTISENATRFGYGAGIATLTATVEPTTVVHSSTINDNQVDGPPDWPSGNLLGNGWALAGHFTLGATVVAGEGPLCSEELQPSLRITTLGHNFIEDTSCLTGALEEISLPNDQQGMPAGLAPLAANGGPTRTNLPGAALVDGIPVGELVCGSLPDQRGIARPQGTACDVGAVELAPSEL